MSPNVQYRLSKNSSTVPVLNQTHSLHNPPPLLLNIHFNTVLPPTPISSKRSLSTRFSNQNSVCICILSQCNGLRPPQPLLTDHPYMQRNREGYASRSSSLRMFLRPPVPSYSLQPNKILPTNGFKGTCASTTICASQHASLRVAGCLQLVFMKTAECCCLAEELLASQ